MPFYAIIVIGAILQVGAIVCTIVATRMTQREQDTRHAEIISNQQRTELLLVHRNKSLRDKFWERYPFGYVLFGSDEGNIVSLPFYDGRLFAEAHWEDTKVEVSEDKKLLRVTIMQPRWKSTNVNVIVHQDAQSTIPNKVGEPVPLGLVKAAGQPEMFFEVIDDNPRKPVYAIGFK